MSSIFKMSISSVPLCLLRDCAWLTTHLKHISADVSLNLILSKLPIQ